LAVKTFYRTKYFGDEEGMFWEELPKVRTRSNFKGPSILPPIPESNYQIPTEFPSLSDQGIIAVDIETFDPDLLERGPGAQRDGRIVGIAIGTEAGFRAYYPVDHAIGGNCDKNRVYCWLSEQLSLPVPKCGANLLYDLDFLTAAGVQVAGPFYDIQVAEPLIDENRFTYTLASLAKKYLNEEKQESAMADWLVRAFGDDENIKSNIWRAPASIVAPYAISDVDLPLRIFAKQRHALNIMGIWDLFIMECKLIPMLLAMRQRGVRVDLARAEEMYAALNTQHARVLEQIKIATGFENVSLWAADELALIFDKLNIRYPRTEKKGAPSFRREWLDHHPHPVTHLIKQGRVYDKLKETFIKGYVLEGHVNGRIHCQFNQLRSDNSGTVSGRFSSSHPNLQNIPRRSNEGQLIRSIFLPDEDQLWFKVDWSQIEYRLIVHYAALLELAGVDEVVERYQNDSSVDYHAMIAQLTGLPRENAKAINFGLAYGQGLWLLCRNLGVDQSEGSRIINEYHRRAPFIRPLLQRAMHKVQRTGYLRTLLGRYRHFTMWEKTNWNNRTRKREITYMTSYVPGAQRAFTHKALNALIQGSAADIMKKAMVQAWESGICDALGAPHLTVHDELDGSLPDNKIAHEAFVELKNIMQSCVTLKVPLLADESVGDNWGTLGSGQLNFLLA
jgi:DNA polymerase I-like protein with 3'-5' exonuclease and polymerase domains